MVNTAREALMRGYSCTGSLRRGKLGKKVRKGWKHATTMQWRWRENDGGCCSYRYLARVAYEALSFPQLPFFPTRSLSPLLIILLSLSSIVGGTTLSLFHTFLLQPNSSLIHTHSLSLSVSLLLRCFPMEAGEDCCVKVAVHVRPLIADEKLQGCKDCVTVVSGKPQVHLLSQLNRVV